MAMRMVILTPMDMAIPTGTRTVPGIITVITMAAVIVMVILIAIITTIMETAGIATIARRTNNRGFYWTSS